MHSERILSSQYIGKILWLLIIFILAALTVIGLQVVDELLKMKGITDDVESALRD